MKKLIISFLTLSLLLTACDNNLDINRDPDSLTSVPLSSQLPAGIAGLIGAEGSYYALIGGFWSQYWTQSNVANQYRDIDGYVIGTESYNAGWRDMYDALGDVRAVKINSEKESNWNYFLVATVLEAQGSQVLTDFYGSIPYSEANNRSILNPKFDKGEEVYTAMIKDLDLALSKPLASSVGKAPGADDLIFAGDMDNWIKFANTLKLKILMRQINSSNSAVAIAGIKSLLTSGAKFLDDDAAMSSFEDNPNLSNPLYESDRRQLNTATNLRMSKTLSSYFDLKADTRKAKYYGAGGPLDQGDFTNASIPSTTIAIVELHPTTPAYLMSREESLFLQAEAQARYGSGDKALYDAAVLENFSKYTLDGSSFIATGGVYEYPTSGTLDEKIEAIITQKWISCFPGNGFEAFFEKNRTGYPKTSAVKQSNPLYIPGQITYSINGSTGGLFPKRIVYPQREKNTNTNTPALLPITTPVWWN
ncbi:SusD/RagB family nutrient-binding outer membrane lipoprotein [Flavobacterium praedii]|uniref:SusD/RagB family nutrient-binding outer membrane lipoprotein n=1 Tax=Flavobacterium praedii TaxID=3002900 RepID=UPI002481BB13|nr:SusD/RagB family nutrient-binding outer membrane lipoprotein [Flavobacterium praedii]